MMNYRAPSPRRVPPIRGKDDQIQQIFREVMTIINTCVDSVISLISIMLEILGIQWIPNLIQQIGIPTCTALICGAFLGVTVATGIGLGVGLGVGLHCSETVFINGTLSNATNATTNATITAGINATNGSRSIGSVWLY